MSIFPGFIAASHLKPNDPHFSSVVLLSGFKGADGSTIFDDESNSNRTLTANGNAQIDTAQAKFGTSSALFDGAGDYISALHHTDFSLGASDFTIEAFVRPVVSNAGFCIIQKYHSSVGSAEWHFSYTGTNLLLTVAHGSGGGSFFSTQGALSTTGGIWHHLVAERSGSTWRVYANGVMIATATSSITAFGATQPMWIGRRNHTSDIPLNGHIDEVRFTKGVARYNSDAGYVVPTSAFPRGN